MFQFSAEKDNFDFLKKIAKKKKKKRNYWSKTETVNTTIEFCLFESV